jgi:hypothetical protein
MAENRRQAIHAARKESRKILTGVILKLELFSMTMTSGRDLASSLAPVSVLAPVSFILHSDLGFNVIDGCGKRCPNNVSDEKNQYAAESDFHILLSFLDRSFLDVRKVEQYQIPETDSQDNQTKEQDPIEC